MAACGIWVALNAANLQEFLTAYSRRNLELEQIEILKQRIGRLERQQQSLSANGAESERQARERLNMHLPGERVIFLKHDDAAVTKSSPAAAAADLPPALPPEPKEDPKTEKPARIKSGENSSRVKKPAGRQ